MQRLPQSCHTWAVAMTHVLFLAEPEAPFPNLTPPLHNPEKHKQRETTPRNRRTDAQTNSLHSTDQRGIEAVPFEFSQWCMALQNPPTATTPTSHSVGMVQLS